MGDEVYVIGVGMIRFGKHPEKSVKELTADAMEAVLRTRRPISRKTSRRSGTAIPCGVRPRGSTPSGVRSQRPPWAYQAYPS